MTRRGLALHLLREAGDRGITTGELLQAGVGSRYGARLMELRELGHVIETQREREGSFRYTLTHDAETGQRRAASLADQEPSEPVVEPSYAARNAGRSPASHQSVRAEPACGELGSLFDSDEFAARRGHWEDAA